MEKKWGHDPEASEWLPLDITGEALANEEMDRIRTQLAPLSAYDGGMLWDSETATLTIQMTTEDALQQARLLLLVTSPTWLRVLFIQVQYSADELSELATRLLEHQTSWIGVSALSGGVDHRANRLILILDRNHPDAPTIIQAVTNLNDPRINLDVYS
ncbi:hypothetical protein ACQPYH_01525 [Kribbella sp. CA-245084]|uniref:hypothetical protein n=1 Tax=Kribbella sp. CA-245084 TaxID=3239940 RepID=UPI003D8BA804